MHWNIRIAAMFPIREWKLSKYDLYTQDNWDYNQHTFAIHKDNKREVIVLHTPKPNCGVYDLGTSRKVLIEHGVPGANFPRQPRQLSSIKIFTRHEIWADLIRAALNKGLVTDPDEQRIQVELNKQIATSPWFRHVDQWNKLNILMTRSQIHIDISGESRDTEDRMITDWKAALDPLTTPQGSKIMQLYQRARGADTVEDRLKPGKSLFSEGMEACLLFPNNNRTHRTLIARTALQFREILVEEEQPKVHHHKYESWMLSGKHLLTAVMSHPWAFEDCIVASKEAAAKLECYRFQTFSLTDTVEIECLIQPGSTVEEGQVLARTLNTEGTVREIVAPDNVMTTVYDVAKVSTRVVGVVGNKVHITLMGKYPAIEGTKICSRHGNKGVIRIDPNMPKTKDGRTIDIIISPESILGKRRCFGTLREMAANWKAFAENKTFAVKHFDEELSVKSLTDAGYGEYTELEGGRMVYVAPLYWLRTNKHAQDMATAKDDVRVANFKGLVPDSGKAGGQRLGHDIATVLKAKGLGTVSEVLYLENANADALEMTDELFHCLLGVKYERQGSQIQQDAGGVENLH